MPSFLVETYLSRGAADVAAREARARSAAAELTREGMRVRFDLSIHVPQDEMCLFVFNAPSSTEVELVAAQAALEAVRIVEAVSSGEE